ncbi:MAG TPA: TrmB family transcriptional regulator [Thermococcus sp.]|uniref:HTH-type transcriptional regulator TrmBL2 n=1 Tax=Thermococcus sp. TaxID=35749 RepID=UPI000F207B23|nr:HTH-type transcriptional regulator TrmBL2 [Thermococcus sp.]RLF76401.1 MAG: TrmB family transcriptional regulator [Thermococci archaeon]MCD6140819.1 TrmB family transcriptional regulator [Thermococcus sp.]MCD6143689.1 TrmB family transcriptional regulator [Thermococcus sp.]RLF80699.1 MAG: TrmB family transcriptional regulator [Thermococci archaeon]RLF82276.1 MAG: TrmB family transcriptional regulator [Thermococci archaeon]
MVKEKIVELLQEHFELNLYEARAYVALVGFGVLTPAELASVSEVPAPRTYDVLRSLEKKGFALSQPGKANKYRPVHPKNILEKFIEEWQDRVKEELEAKRKAKEELIELMTPLIETEIPKYGVERVWVVRGIRNSTLKTQEMLEGVEKEILLADNGYVAANLDKEITAAVDKGAKAKILVLKQILPRLETSKIMDYYKAGKLELKALDKIELPMLICDEEVFFALEDLAARYFNYETQVWVKDFRVVELFKSKFNEYWKKGKKV